MLPRELPSGLRFIDEMESRVYWDGSPSGNVYKVFPGISGVSVEILEFYQDRTAQVKRLIDDQPLTLVNRLGVVEKKLVWNVTPIDEIGLTMKQLPFSRCPYVPGINLSQHLEACTGPGWADYKKKLLEEINILEKRLKDYLGFRSHSIRLSGVNMKLDYISDPHTAVVHITDLCTNVFHLILEMEHPQKG